MLIWLPSIDTFFFISFSPISFFIDIDAADAGFIDIDGFRRDSLPVFSAAIFVDSHSASYTPEDAAHSRQLISASPRCRFRRRRACRHGANRRQFCPPGCRFAAARRRHDIISPPFRHITLFRCHCQFISSHFPLIFRALMIFSPLCRFDYFFAFASRRRLICRRFHFITFADAASSLLPFFMLPPEFFDIRHDYRRH